MQSPGSSGRSCLVLRRCVRRYVPIPGGRAFKLKCILSPEVFGSLVKGRFTPFGLAVLDFTRSSRRIGLRLFRSVRSTTGMSKTEPRTTKMTSEKRREGKTEAIKYCFDEGTGMSLSRVGGPLN